MMENVSPNLSENGETQTKCMRIEEGKYKKSLVKTCIAKKRSFEVSNNIFHSQIALTSDRGRKIQLFASNDCPLSC